MAKKKKKDEEFMDLSTNQIKTEARSRDTLLRVNADINDRFRSICGLLEISAKKELEELMTKWSDVNQKKIPKEKLQKMFGLNV